MISEYPEHEKLSKVKDQSQAIGQFLEGCGYSLGEWIEEGNDPWKNSHFVPLRRPINNILAEYFGIDLNIIETEKRAMLDELHRAAG